MTGKVAYYEIPADEYDRAVEFYESVFEFTIKDSPVGDYPYGVISEGGEEIGALVGADAIPYGEDTEVSYEPSESAGVLVYLNVDGPVEAVLERVESAGGSITVEPQPVGDDLILAIVIDSEGNRIGLLTE